MGTEFDGGLVVLILIVIAVCVSLNLLTKPKAKTKEDFAKPVDAPNFETTKSKSNRDSNDSSIVAAIVGSDALMGGSDTHISKPNHQDNDFGSSSGSISSGE
jgi:hypothetical protein